MIDVKELRVGNWIIGCNNIPFQMTAYNFIDHDLKQSSTMDKSCPSPIPLTPDILEKCLFVEINHIDGYKFYSSKNKKRNEYIPPITIYENRTEVMGYSVAHCKYLHQLQNLVHALTQTELTIKL